MATELSSLKTKQVTARWRWLGRRMVLGLGMRTTRWVIVAAALGYLGWLLVGSVWQPLRQPVLLPGGVSSTNPEVNSELLQQITGGRVERSQYTAKSLFAFEPLFAPTTSPQPGGAP